MFSSSFDALPLEKLQQYEVQQIEQKVFNREIGPYLQPQNIQSFLQIIATNGLNHLEKNVTTYTNEIRRDIRLPLYSKLPSPQERNKKSFVIYRKAGEFGGWPTIAKTNDTLYITFSGGRQQHLCPFGKLFLLESIDQGYTWTFLKSTSPSIPYLVSDPVRDVRDSSILPLNDTYALVTWFSSIAYATNLKACQIYYGYYTGNTPLLDFGRDIF